VNYTENVSDKIYEALFYKLFSIRIFEETVADKYAEQQMRCPTHFSIGQEAVAVGVCHSLKKSDQVFSAHRAHAHYLAKGGDMKALLAEFYGKETGCAGGRGGSMHLLDRTVGFLGSVPIVGSTIPIAVGTAFGNKLKAIRDIITVVFFGEAATEEGVFYESINFAILHELPVLFVCEDNALSVKTKLIDRRSPKSSIKKIVEGFGIKAHESNGQDCLSTYNLAVSIVSEMRNKAQPMFVLLKTARYLEHCGPKREKEKSAGYFYGSDDPVYVMAKNIKENRIKEMESQILSHIQDAFAFAEASKFPNKSDLALNLYKEESHV
jgi:pyruvate dehydrogenase E1 component alpha subunit